MTQEEIKSEIIRRNELNKRIYKENPTDFGKGITAGYVEILSFIDSLGQSAKRNYKECNRCEFNRPLKDKIGWSFRGCYGGNYQGKPIAEIELCPLKIEQEPQGLAESEDERIRKWLINAFTDALEQGHDQEVDGMKPSMVLAWLEKQKEPKNPLEDYSRGYNDGYYHGFTDKKQKEQKPSTQKYRVGDVMRTKQEAAEGITDGLPVIVSVDDDYYYCTNEKIPISKQEEYEFPPMNMKQKPAENDGKELLYVCNKSYKIGYRDGKRDAEQKPAEKSEIPTNLDLEKEFQEFCKDYPFPWSSAYVNEEYIKELCMGVARYFYELGLNARKEE